MVNYFSEHPYFLFQNIAHIPTENILDIALAFFRSALLAMANRHDDKLIIQHLKLIFELENDHQFNLVATYIVAILDRTPEEVKLMVKHLKTNKGKFMSTLEMLLKEGEEIGIKQGEEIGIRKEEAYQSATNLLKILEAFPNWTIANIVRFSEVKKNTVIALQQALLTKNKSIIQQVIKVHFLQDFELTKVKQVKINKLVTALLKKK